MQSSKAGCIGRRFIEAELPVSCARPCALGVDQDPERLLRRGGQHLSAAGSPASGAGPRRRSQRAQVCGGPGGRAGGRRPAGAACGRPPGRVVGDAEAPPLPRTSRRGRVGGADPRPSLLLCRRGRQGRPGESALPADLGNRRARGVREAAKDRRPWSNPEGRWGTLTFFTRLPWE